MSIAPLSRREVFFMPMVSVIQSISSATKMAMISVSFFILNTSVPGFAVKIRAFDNNIINDFKNKSIGAAQSSR